MAYLQEIFERKCDACRLKKATVTLHNRYNAETGAYCAKCGNRHLKEMLASEEKEPYREVWA